MGPPEKNKQNNIYLFFAPSFVFVRLGEMPRLSYFDSVYEIQLAIVC